MDNILLEFVAECHEQLAVLDEAVVELETTTDPGQIDFVFRAVHTVKGGAGMLGLSNLTAVAHAAEDVLGHFRTGALEINAPSISIILESVDALQTILAGIAEDGQERDTNFDDLIHRLELLAGIPAQFGTANGKPLAESDDDPEAGISDCSTTTVMAAGETVTATPEQPESAVEPGQEPVTVPDDAPSPATQVQNTTEVTESQAPSPVQSVETSGTRP